MSLEVKIVDSVYFDTPADFVHIGAYNDSSYLGRNPASDKLYLFDQRGRKKKVIDRQGEGPLEYGEILNYGLTPSDDIVIFDGSKVLTFINNSDEIKSCSVNLNEVLAQLNTYRLFAHENDRYFFASTSRDDASFMEYFESVHTITVMDNSCSYKNIGGYPEQSMYREKVYITGYDSRIWMNPGEKKIYQMFRLEKKIYVLDSETNTLIQTIPIDPDQFGNLVYKKDDSIENVMYVLQRNPRFIDFVVGDQYIVVYYMTGLKEEDVSSSLVGYNEKTGALVKRLFSIYDRNGNKIGVDFSNKDIRYLLGFDKAGRLLYQTIPEDESVVIYKAELLPQ